MGDQQLFNHNPPHTPQAQDINLFATDTYLFTMGPQRTVAPKVRQPNRFAVSGLEMRMRKVLQAPKRAVG